VKLDPVTLIRISLGFSNPGPERRAELTAVAHSPDGKTVYRFLDEDLGVSLPPGSRAWSSPR
jgi:hypothetical protein